MNQLETQGKSFLLSWFDDITAKWVNSYSIAALPLLRRKKADDIESQQHARDVFLITMFLSSIVLYIVSSFAYQHMSELSLRLMATLALYRAIDIGLTLLRSGVFLSFRGDVSLMHEPTWRIQRVMLGVLLNYVELVFWYAIVYFYISAASLNHFSPNHLDIPFKALNLSFSTMTTVGYGVYAPASQLSTLISFIQAITAIILMVMVVGILLALLTSGNKLREIDALPSPRSSWLTPIVATAMLWSIIFLALGLAKTL